MRSWYLVVCKSITAVFTCLAASQGAYTQDANPYRFERITSENQRIEKGLSQNSVSCMLMDSRGFLWFGTWDGLNRYDGYHYRIFRPGYRGSSGEISNKSINCIFEDKDHGLWIGTFGGLNYYNRKTGLFTCWKAAMSGQPGLSGDTVHAVAQDRRGLLWVGSSAGLNCFDPESRRFVDQQFIGIKQLGPVPVRHLMISADRLWIACDHGLWSLGTTDGRLMKHPLVLTEVDSDREVRRVNRIYGEDDARLWLCTPDGLLLFDVAAGSARKISLYATAAFPNDGGTELSCLLKDRNGKYWVGTQGAGVFLLDRDLKPEGRLKHDPGNIASLSNDFISGIISDRTGNIWIATSWNGVNKMVPGSSGFHHVYPVSSDNRSLNNNLVWSFLEYSADEFWIGTERGVNIYHIKTGLYSYMTASKDGLAGNKVRCFLKDGETVWIGYNSEGLSRYLPGERRFTHYTHQPDDPGSLSHNGITCLFKDPQGRIWIGTRGGGLNILYPGTGKFERYFVKAGDRNSLPNNTVWSVYLSKNGLYWLGTAGGLSVFDPLGKTFKNYHHEPGNTNSLSSDDVFSVYEDPKGIIWIATSGGGLNRFDPRTANFKAFLESDGLSNNVVYNILPDSSGKLWMSTNSGISCFDPGTLTFVNYDVRDGIQSNEFNFGAALLTSLGWMAFGGMNGFNYFRPGEIRKNNVKPLPLITRLIISDNVRNGEIFNGDTLVLTYRDNDITLGFSALDYTNPQKNRYMFMLEGIDETWKKTASGENSTSYTDIRPGHYTFRLKGSNNDGIWSEKEFRLSIIITPPWYATWLFRSFLIILFVSIAALLIYLRIRRIQRKHEIATKLLSLENQVLDIERKALRLQMNPHFIFNAMNSIQGFIVDNETDKAINYLAKFSRLMRLILTNSGHPLVSLEDELKAVSYYVELEQLRFGDKFTCEVSVDDDIDQADTEIPPMLIQPFVENAIVHGFLSKPGTGLIRISVKLDGEILKCIIEDNGIGRERSKELKSSYGLVRPSQGLFITGKRFELFRKSGAEKSQVRIIDLNDEQGNPAGTRVELDIEPRLKD